MLNSANRGKEQIIFGDDSVVIQKFISGIPGGRTLDVTGYPVANVLAGTAIIKVADAGAGRTGEFVYKPMPIKKDGKNEDETDKYVYDTLPEGATYVGILYRSISVSDPQASIMVDGVVNEAILPYGFASIKSAFATAVPHIIYMKDEVA